MKYLAGRFGGSISQLSESFTENILQFVRNLSYYQVN